MSCRSKTKWICPLGCRVYETFAPLHRVTLMQILSVLSGALDELIPARNVSPGLDGRPGQWEVDVNAALSAICP